MSQTPPPGIAAQATASRRFHPALAAALGAVAGAAITGTVWWATSASDADVPSGPAFTATGKVTVFGSWVNGQDGEGCVGTDDFADLRGGTAVTVSDLDGHKLAQGTLVDGIAGEVVGDSCTWPLSVSGVPSGTTQYRVQIGDRAPVIKGREQLQAGVKVSYGVQQ
ncbi:hypothetical protein [Streptomyces echinatus]|uniref:Uncharacterized protein n=1 Tax=Streptomyces echinatus TaxID=67293 RepID=A0A7W9Q3M8_9ACTN|nr:hypothetical protein [Streptomyces echinatus]MBB5932563.1 hypothetical protein [Streptomyces echinatus]